MKRAGLTITLVLSIVATASAAEITAGDAKLITGKGRALYERMTVGGVVVSDFAEPEKGKLIDHADFGGFVTKKQPHHFSFDQIQGLKVNHEVRYAGINCGRVTGIGEHPVTDDGDLGTARTRVLVTIETDGDIPIADRDKAVISKGYTGNVYMDIMPYQRLHAGEELGKPRQTSREKGKLIDHAELKAAELIAKVKALKADAPCKLTKGKSKFGDETVTLENGLVKVVIVPKYGGRIIEISNKATGANIFVDNYQNADKAPDWKVDRRGRKSPPTLLGGWIEGVDDRNAAYWNTPHTIKVIRATPKEVTVQTRGEVPNETWGVKGTVTVKRTIVINRGTALVGLTVTFTNHSGNTEREMRFRPHVRHALGRFPQGDDVWVSSTGYVTHIPADHRSDCYVTSWVEKGTDPWQGIVDRSEREGVAILPRCEINGRLDVFGSGKGEDYWYTFENTGMVREHVIEGDELMVAHTYAPVLNFDAITCVAGGLAAAEFVPEKLHVAPGETVKALAGAAWLGRVAGARVTFTPAFVKHGREVGVAKPITLDAALLVAQPKVVAFEVPDGLPAGPCTLSVRMTTDASGDKTWTSRYRLFVAGRTGAFLSVVAPTDDGYGKGLSVTGKRVDAQVIVQKNDAAGTSSGIYRIGDASLPWQTRITPVKDTFKVEHTVDFSKMPADVMLRSFGMTFPYRLGTDASEVEVDAHRLQQGYQKVLRVTVGGNSGRDEQWLVDQARGAGGQEYHKPVPYWALSDSADRLPVWRFGGVLQRDGNTAWVWKASNYDSSPMPMIQERKAAGWVDAYSLLTKRGVLVVMPDMQRDAPKEIIFDGEAGAFHVYFFPPHVPAMSLKKASALGKSRAETWGLGPDGKARFVFTIVPHASDLTGHLPLSGNVAGKIRTLVEDLGP